MKTMTCYEQVNNGTYCQETYESVSRDAGRRSQQLRGAGYDVRSASLGPQVTRVGMVKLTIVDIRHGVHADTYDLPTENWQRERI